MTVSKSEITKTSVKQLRPLSLSFLIHFGIVFIFLSLNLSINLWLKFKPRSDEGYEIPLEISLPKELQNLTKIKDDEKVVLKSVNENKTSDPKLSSRSVFGTSRDSYTDESNENNKNTIDAKMGNTLSKSEDFEKLEDSDPTSLPTPVDDYLVSEMPVVISEVRPDYPKEAKDQQLEGVVSLDVLIDELGLVRSVQVLEGAIVFRNAALESMKRFKFKPAKVDGKPVAVRIRYSLNFKLKY